MFFRLSVLALLAGCAASELAPVPVAGTPAPAPMQLRAAVPVTVDGAVYEVRRTLFVWEMPLASYLDDQGRLVEPVQPAPRESADGAPAVAVAGVPPSEDGWDIASRAIATACGFDPAVDPFATYGLDGDSGYRHADGTGEVIYRLQGCPALDG